jgi:hypothetical protein
MKVLGTVWLIVKAITASASLFGAFACVSLGNYRITYDRTAAFSGN